MSAKQHPLVNRTSPKAPMTREEMREKIGEIIRETVDLDGVHDGPERIVADVIDPLLSRLEEAERERDVAMERPGVFRGNVGGSENE